LPEKADSQKYFKISAFNGETIELISLIDNYRNDKILFFCLDSIIINDRKHIVNQRFDSLLNLDLNYENDFAKNQIQLYGSFQVQYTDSIWGEHYKKYYFSQLEYLPTAYRNATISKITISLCALLLIFLIYWLLILPNKKLFVIYSSQGKKYVVKRGYKRHWQKGIIPILSSVLKGNTLSVICKKHRNILTQHFTEISDMKNSFIICTNHKIFSDETIKDNNITFNNDQTDIEDFYNARSGDYPALLKHIFRKTLLYRCRKSLCNSEYWFIRRTGKLLVDLCTIVSAKYYYAIPTKTNSDISFRHYTLRHSKFVIEFSKAKQDNIRNINQKFNISCLNAYYENTPNKRCDALICYAMSGNYIFWNVLLPEYEKDKSVSLKSVYNTFQYKQELTKESENQISQNLKLLKREVKKQLKNCDKLEVYTIEVPVQENIHDFEIIEVSCPGFLYLIEDTEKQSVQRLYSPFKDGSKVKKDVYVRKFKTENCHLCFSFLPPNLLKGDTKLVKRVSEELIKIKENSDITLEIKNKMEIIFKNINTKM